MTMKSKLLSVSEMNKLIKKTIHPNEKCELPRFNSVYPNKTETVLKVGNLYELKTSLGNCIVTGGDLMGLCRLMDDPNTTGWSLYKHWQQKPKTWGAAFWALELWARNIDKKSKYDDFAKEVTASKLLENDSLIAKQLVALMKNIRRQLDI